MTPRPWSAQVRETKRIDLPRSDLRVVVSLFGNPFDLIEPERAALGAVIDAVRALEDVCREPSTTTPAAAEDASS